MTKQLIQLFKNIARVTMEYHKVNRKIKWLKKNTNLSQEEIEKIVGIKTLYKI
jgi:hypothetical protein